MKTPKNVTPAPDAATAFLREVDEALQQERLLALWHRSKWFILAGALGLIVAVAAMQAWGAWQQHRARTLAAQWYAFSQLNSDAARAKQLPEILANSTGGTRALAAYTQAQMATTPAEKAKSYALVYNGNFPQWLKDIARLNAAIALAESDPTAAKSQLEILTQVNPEKTPGPAYAPALELLALMAQKQGDETTARGYTEKLLQVPGLPADMHQRALQRLGALSTLAR